MLDSDQLRDQLRVFCDQDFGSFAGFPTTVERARDAWAGAFDAYLSHVEETIPRPPPPTDAHPSLELGQVKSRFAGTIKLLPGTAAADAAQDFADAWQAAIDAITPGGTATDSALGTYVLVKLTNAAALHDPLKAALTALFLAPSTSTVQRLGDIAAAFHSATTSLIASMTYTPSGSTPVTSPITLR